MVIDFLSYGWPINYTAPTRPVSSLYNHPSASQFASNVQDDIDTESSWNAIAGPFVYRIILFALLSRRSLNEVHRSDGSLWTSFSRKAVTVLFSRKIYAERIDSSLSIPRTTSSSASLIRETFILTLVALSVYVPQP